LSRWPSRLIRAEERDASRLDREDATMAQAEFRRCSPPPIVLAIRCQQWAVHEAASRSDGSAGLRHRGQALPMAPRGLRVAPCATEGAGASRVCGSAPRAVPHGASPCPTSLSHPRRPGRRWTDGRPAEGVPARGQLHHQAGPRTPSAVRPGASLGSAPSGSSRRARSGLGAWWARRGGDRSSIDPPLRATGWVAVIPAGSR
jgi:hypothetical protein